MIGMYNKKDMQRLVQSLNEFETAVNEMIPAELELLAQTAVESVDAVLGSEQSAKEHARYLSCVLAGTSRSKLSAHFMLELTRVMHPQWKRDVEEPELEMAVGHPRFCGSRQ